MFCFFVCVFLQGKLVPYIFDSTSKSVQWIEAHFKTSTVEIISQRDDRFPNVLDLAIRYFKTFLF